MVSFVHEIHCHMHFLTQLSQASSDLAQLQKQCQNQREETQRLEQQLQQLQLEQRRNPAANTVSWIYGYLDFMDVLKACVLCKLHLLTEYMSDMTVVRPTGTRLVCYESLIK